MGREGWTSAPQKAQIPEPGGAWPPIRGHFLQALLTSSGHAMELTGRWARVQSQGLSGTTAFSPLLCTVESLGAFENTPGGPVRERVAAWGERPGWNSDPRKRLKKQTGASLVAQWLRIRLPMQGTRVGALVREDPTCHGATKPVRHNY